MYQGLSILLNHTASDGKPGKGLGMRLDVTGFAKHDMDGAAV